MTVIYVLLSFLSLCIIITNSFVLFLVSKRRSLRNPTNICLCSLAASDLLAGALAIPLVISCNITRDFDGICYAMDLISRFISISTALHLLAVTIERYVMIVYALKYKMWVNTKRVVITMSTIWLFSAVLATIQLTWQMTQTRELSDKTDIIYDFMCFAIVVVIPLIIIAASYVQIFFALRYQLKIIQRYNNPIEKNAELRKRQMERKAAIIFACMILMFIICWFSYFLDPIILALSGDKIYPYEVGEMLAFLRFLTSFLNPLLYTFLKEDFKLATKRIFCKRYREDTTYLYRTDVVPSNESAL